MLRFSVPLALLAAMLSLAQAEPLAGSHPHPEINSLPDSAPQRQERTPLHRVGSAGGQAGSGGAHSAHAARSERSRWVHWGAGRAVLGP